MDFRDNKSVSVSPPPLRDGRPAVLRWLGIYFAVLITLTIVAFQPGAITIATLFMIVPGLVLLASPTLLYYSAALLPSFLINRLLGRPLVAYLVAIVSLGSAALLPHYVSRLESVFAAKSTFRGAYPKRPFYFGTIACPGFSVCLVIARD
jgi:hypothetical protein